MAFEKNSSQQISVDDSVNRLTNREKRFLERSWAVPFSKHYFEQINEERFAVLYSDNEASRPNTPINVIIGMLILKEMNGWTDEQCIEALLFNIAVQYALHTTSFQEQPISDRTLSRFRERCAQYYLETGKDLLKEEIKSLAAYQAGLLNISPAIKRMDSLMVDSSCKKMSRLELLYTVVRNMVEKLIKAEAKDLLDEGLIQYSKEGDKNNVCYRLEKDRVDSKLEEIVQDAVKLRENCELAFTPEQLEGNKEYQLLVRLLSEQTEEKDGKTTLKPGKEITTDSLQSPSDEDATYRNKAGKSHKGYVGNLVECCDENGNVITDFDLQPNTYRDEQFAKDVISTLGEDGGTKVLTVDGAYATADTISQAEENDIDLVSGKLTGQQTNPIIGEFKIDDSGKIVECPAGNAPISSEYNEETGTATAHFSLLDCTNCPYRDQCVAKDQKKSTVVRITDKQVIRVEQAKKMDGEEYKTLVNKRNGVEGLPSLLRRKYDVDHMPIRGLVRAKMWFALKIGAINCTRLVKAMAVA